MKKNILYLLLLMVGGCTSSSENKENKTTTMNATASDKLVVYQIFTRLFGNQNLNNKFNGTLAENGSGKFNDINETALAELKKFGVSHVWYTGVIEHATMSDFTANGIEKDNPEVIKGIAGSPYAIKDYYDVNPALAVNVDQRMAEFEAMVERTHAAGLQVIIDFVPNHVARHYFSDVKPAGVKDFGETDDNTVGFKPTNNFYYLPGTSFKVPAEVKVPVRAEKHYSETPAKVTGNDVFSPTPSINDWYETVKLNYGVDYQNNRTPHFEPVPDTWLKLLDILKYWQSKGVDGFRCDMAEMVPVEFWGWVIPQLKAIKPTVFIAEIYNPNEYGNYLQKGKFDYLYDKVGLYDSLRKLMTGDGTVEYFTWLWQNESGNFSNKMLRFLENHDEQRIASKFFAGDMNRGKTAMALAATLQNGPIMYYFGQEVGVTPDKAEGFQGDDGRTTIFDYWGVPEFQAWVNGGKYDGGKLTDEQKALRSFYEQLNHFVVKNEAVANGKFWDLQYVNDHGLSDGYDTQKVFSFVRYTENQRLLFVYNFDLKNPKNTVVKLPQDLMKILKLNEKEVVFKELFNDQSSKSVAYDNLTNLNDKQSGLPVTLAPFSFLVYSF